VEWVGPRNCLLDGGSEEGAFLGHIGYWDMPAVDILKSLSPEAALSDAALCDDYCSHLSLVCYMSNTEYHMILIFTTQCVFQTCLILSLHIRCFMIDMCHCNVRSCNS